MGNTALPDMMVELTRKHTPIRHDTVFKIFTTKCQLERTQVMRSSQHYIHVTSKYLAWKKTVLMKIIKVKGDTFSCWCFPWSFQQHRFTIESPYTVTADAPCYCYRLLKIKNNKQITGTYFFPHLVPCSKDNASPFCSVFSIPFRLPFFFFLSLHG